MSSITVFVNEQGKLAGFGEKGGRAYAKFLRELKGLESGQTATFTFKLPRSPKHHKFFFWKMRGLFKRQEQFTDSDRMREWLVCGAGYCNLAPGADGVPCAIPMSMEFDKMDEAEFTELHRRINDFLWTHHALAFLWPHLTYPQQHDMIEQWHREHA